MVEIPLVDYSDPEVIDRQNTTPNAACDVDGEFADVRNLMHLCREQASRIAALEAQLAARTGGTSKVAQKLLADAAHELELAGLNARMNVRARDLLAALSPAPEAQQEPMEISAGDFLARVKDDAALWAAEFRKTALRLGYSDMDEGWLIGWFANAIENTEIVRRDQWSRPSEQAVTEAMVEAGAKAIVACRFEDESEPVTDYDLELSRAALKAAMEARDE